MKLSEAHADDQDVVGSPYWIAPEIIEMSTPTAACDIWFGIVVNCFPPLKSDTLPEPFFYFFILQECWLHYHRAPNWQAALLRSSSDGRSIPHRSGRLPTISRGNIASSPRFPPSLLPEGASDEEQRIEAPGPSLAEQRLKKR